MANNKLDRTTSFRRKPIRKLGNAIVSYSETLLLQR